MPYPRNLQVARDLESLVRSLGVVPATVAIIKGSLKIGLNSDELEYLAKPSSNCYKASSRDIPLLCSAGNIHSILVPNCLYMYIFFRGNCWHNGSR